VLITSVELRNVKSYGDAAIPFTEGTNAICGENGAGKSTILEAIGFALFDHLPYKQDDFVRQGQKTATIAVSFISSRDEREYQVVRKCGNASDYYVYDPELDAKLVEGKGDTVAWLKDHLGIEPNADLEALFRDAVGVPQGLMTSAFLQTARLRRGTFDSLLHVDEYDGAWSSLRDVIRLLRDRTDEIQLAIAALETEARRLPQVQKQAEQLETSIGEIQARITDLAEELDRISRRRKELDAVQKELASLQNQLRSLDAQRDRLDGQLKDARNEVAQSEAAGAAVQEARPGQEAYQAALKELEGLEKEREARKALQNQLTKAEKSAIQIEGNLKRLESDLNEVKKAEARSSQLEPDVQRQGQLEEAVEKAKLDALELAQSQLRVAEAEGRLNDLRARMSELEKGLKALEEAEADLTEARDRLEEISSSLTSERETRAAMAAQIERLEGRIRTLQEADAVQCPVCEQPLTSQHREAVLSRCQDEVEERTRGLKASETKIGKLEAERSDVETSRTRLENAIRDLPRLAERQNLAHQVEEEEEAQAKVQERLQALASAPDQAQSMSAQLDEMGDPRREWEDCKRSAESGPELQSKRREAEEARDTITASMERLRSKLETYAQLDEKLEAQRAIRDRNAEAHRRYLENVKIAESLSGRMEKVKSLETEEEALASQRMDLRKELERITETYEPEAHETAKNDEDKLRAEGGALDGTLGAQRQQLESLQADISQLVSAQEELASKSADLQELEGIKAWMEFARGVLKDAGPHITHQLVQLVSLEAGQIFAQIMANRLGQLYWKEDYEIVLEQDGRQRAFSQLSGGEQMAAALAVRLALLRLVSDIDVAFFDEPTANLDDARRENLAEEISDIRGFSQLFVISHDDTFERLTNNLIRVRKENGQSLVEVA
jgi:exonuclease SbcC